MYFFCSICLSMHENIEDADMCCAIQLPQWKNDTHSDASMKVEAK